MEESKCLGTTLTNQNSIQGKIKRRMNSGNACYHSAQDLLSSNFLSKNLKIKIHRTIILPVVLYGCGIWSLTLREERWLRLFENRVMGRIFGPRRDEITGEWRKVHIDELNDLYSSPNIIRVIKSRRMRWVEHVARMRDRKDAYVVVVGRPLGRLRRRCDNNIKKDLQEVGWGHGLDRCCSR